MIVEGNVHNCNSKISTKKVQLNCGQTACFVFDNCKKRTGATEFFGTSNSS